VRAEPLQNDIVCTFSGESPLSVVMPVHILNYYRYILQVTPPR